MGRTSYRKIHLGTYGKCSLCGYEINNNKIAMRLHAKYSHPEYHESEYKTKNKLSCVICKKQNCRIH